MLFIIVRRKFEKEEEKMLRFIALIVLYQLPRCSYAQPRPNVPLPLPPAVANGQLGSRKFLLYK